MISNRTIYDKLYGKNENKDKDLINKNKDLINKNRI